MFGLSLQSEVRTLKAEVIELTERMRKLEFGQKMQRDMKTGLFYPGPAYAPFTDDVSLRWLVVEIAKFLNVRYSPGSAPTIEKIKK